MSGLILEIMDMRAVHQKRARTSTKRAQLKTLKIIHQPFHLVSEGTNQHLKGYP